MIGDRTRLAQLLSEAGSAYDPDGVAALIGGVLAAPEEIGTSWHALVADPTPEPLAAALDAVFRELAARYSDGISGGDFAALPRPARVKALREELAKRGLAAFIVPRSDEYQGEYVPQRGQRLAWLTGFTGSAGAAIVLARRAAVFVDGRYTLQADAQVDPALFELHHLVDDPPPAWLAGALGQGEAVGYDPWLHTPLEVERLRTAAERAGGELRAVDDNPLDKVWPDQPPPPLAPVYPQPAQFAGEASEAKRRRLGQALAAEGVAAAVLTMPESIAWLLNIRGGDVPHTPLPLSYAIVKADGAVTLFVDRRKLLPGLDRHLGNAVAVEMPDRLGPALDALARAGGAVQVDPATAAAWVFDRLNA